MRHFARRTSEAAPAGATSLPSCPPPATPWSRQQKPLLLHPRKDSSLRVSRNAVRARSIGYDRTGKACVVRPSGAAGCSSHTPCEVGVPPPVRSPLQGGCRAPSSLARLTPRPAFADGSRILLVPPRRGVVRGRQERSAPGPLTQGVSPPRHPRPPLRFGYAQRTRRRSASAMHVAALNPRLTE